MRCQHPPQTSSFSVDVGLVPRPFPSPGPSGYPVVFGTFRDGSYVGPEGAPVPFSQSPAAVAAGQTAWLLGSDLGITGASDRVYLLPPTGGAEVDVTAWKVAADSSAAKFVLAVPPAAGTAPAGTRILASISCALAAARWARPAPPAAARPPSASRRV